MQPQPTQSPPAQTHLYHQPSAGHGAPYNTHPTLNPCYL